MHCARWNGDPIFDLTEPPAANVFPVDLDDVKAALRIVGTDQDEVLAGFLAAAVDHFDGYAGELHRALITQDWAVSVRGANAEGRIYAPVTPAQSLVSVEYFDPAGDIQTADLADFTMTTRPDRAYIFPVRGKTWPATEAREDAITATFRCGYGDTAADVPASIRQAIILTVGHLYEHREASTMLKLEVLPLGVASLVSKYKLWRAV
jgi:uncharacterized phiE125 gp8 family phage protein